MRVDDSRQEVSMPGMGPISMTGHPDAVGARQGGGIAVPLSGHPDLANPAHRVDVAALWGVDSVPAAPGQAQKMHFAPLPEGTMTIA